MKRWIACVLAVLAAATLSGCADPLRTNTEPGGPLVVGSGDFAESEMVMEIYAEALRSTGADVQTRPRIGARELYVDAVRNGELAVVPDYTGNLLKYVDPGTQATRSQQVYDELKNHLGPQLDLLQQSQAEDSDVLTVTGDTARTGIRSMADLGPRCGNLVLGAPAEWKSRWADKIARIYGCRFHEIRSIEAGSVTVQGLTSNAVQVANLFTTSAQIRENKLVKLDDPRDMFPAQNIVPLVGQGRLSPKQADAVNRASAALTTDALTDLNRRLDVDKDNPTDLAREFLHNAGL